MTAGDVLIVGTGQAALQLAGALRDEGFAGPIRMVGEELHLPYQRPPLSKAFMSGDCAAGDLTFQPLDWYRSRNIELTTGTSVARIDREARHVELADGGHLSYSQLVLATGARNRQLPGIDRGLPGVLDLRSLDDAAAIRERMGQASDVVVVGGGFLGLEFAAVAALKGVRVTVVEAATSLMAHAVCPEVGNVFLAHHQALGVTVLLGAMVRSVRERPEGGCGVTLDDGRELRCDLVVTSIGVVPNVELAVAAGLETGNGIIVDERLFTGDPNIAAIGDCASFRSRFAPDACRIESVQNAIDQARCLAKTLAGRPTVYDAVPWFWSDQGGLKLQIAGLAAGADRTVVRGDPDERRLSAYRFRGGRLVAVESVARPADHMTARRLLDAGVAVTPADVENPSLDLKSLLAPPAGVAAA